MLLWKLLKGIREHFSWNWQMMTRRWIELFVKLMKNTFCRRHFEWWSLFLDKFYSWELSFKFRLSLSEDRLDNMPPIMLFTGKLFHLKSFGCKATITSNFEVLQLYENFERFLRFPKSRISFEISFTLNWLRNNSQKSTWNDAIRFRFSKVFADFTEALSNPLTKIELFAAFQAKSVIESSR